MFPPQNLQVNRLCGQQQNVNRLFVRRLADSAKDPAAKNEKLVGRWLVGCSGMVFAAVALGGLTAIAVVFYCIRAVLTKALESTSKRN